MTELVSILLPMSASQWLYSAAEIRRLEAAVMARGTSGERLMERAGAAAADLLRQTWPAAKVVAVVCGGGNNGGDGWVVARLLHAAGLQCSVYSTVEPDRLRGEARQAYLKWSSVGKTASVVIPRSGIASAELAKADVIVDAVLGLGVQRPLRDEVRAVVEMINNSGRPVLSLDLPSGLDPDTGFAEPAVRATCTISFIGLKLGSFLGQGPSLCGQLQLDPLGIDLALERPQPGLQRMTASLLDRFRRPRPRESHKGEFGRVLVIGGGKGMPGAIRLAGEAALRAGAGLVTVASLQENQATVIGERPELMFRAVDQPQELVALQADFDVVVVGPGLGATAWAQNILRTVLSSARAGQSLVLDADALNLIAADESLADQYASLARVSLQANSESVVVMTPHPGEASRLLAWTTQVVQADRPLALQQLLERYSGNVVLKGAGTLVGQAGQTPWLCEFGNAAMAVPGMGDVLTGAIAALLAFGKPSTESVAAAVLAHALAGDRLAKTSHRGLLALELAQDLPRSFALQTT